MIYLFGIVILCLNVDVFGLHWWLVIRYWLSWSTGTIWEEVRVWIHLGIHVPTYDLDFITMDQNVLFSICSMFKKKRFIYILVGITYIKTKLDFRIWIFKIIVSYIIFIHSNQFPLYRYLYKNNIIGTFTKYNIYLLKTQVPIKTHCFKSSFKYELKYLPN